MVKLVGTGGNQVPTNNMLGNMAFQNKEGVSADLVSLAAGTASAPSLIPSGDTNTGMWFPAADTIALSTSGLERLQVNGSGNVGIGTSSPLAKLDVAGALRSGGDATYRGDVVIQQLGNSATANGGLELKADAASAGYGARILTVFDGASSYNLGFQTRSNSAAWSTQMTIMPSGNFGLGQTSVTAVFGRTISATGPGGATYRVTGATVSGYFFSSDGLGVVGVAAETNHPLTFFTNSLERVRITNTGNVGIGTTTPVSNRGLTVNAATDYFGIELTVAGGQVARWMQESTGGVYFDYGVASQAGRFLSIRSASTDVMRFTSAGNIGIGTTTPSVKLDVVGGANVSTELDYNYTAASLPSAAPALDLNFAMSEGVDQRITFTRATTATFVGSNGLIQTAAANVPRIEYDPSTLECLGLLIEEARINRVLQSEDFTVSPWAATVAGTSTRVNDGSAPGFQLGLITATSANGGLRQVISGLTNSQVYTLSFYIQSTTTSVLLLFENGTAAFGSPHSVTINPSNGTAGALTGFTSVNITPFGSGYIYRLVTAPAGGTLIANIEWRISTNGDSIRIGRPQFEAGSFATSYIPTTTVAVQRNGDVAQLGTSSFPYSAVAGTWVASFQTLFSGVTAATIYVLNLDANANKRVLYIGSGGEGISSYDGTTIVTSGTDVTGPISKSANAYTSSERAVVSNGSTVITGASVASYASASTVYLGSIGSSLGAGVMSGWIRQISYYPARLTNAQLQALTT